MARFAHPAFRQMQARRADLFHKPGITGDEQPRQPIELLCQRPAPARLRSAHHYHTAMRQGARGPRPIGLAVVGHQDQRQALIEAALLSC